MLRTLGYTWDGVIHKMSDKQWGAMLDVHVSGKQTALEHTSPGADMLRHRASDEACMQHMAVV